MESVNTINYVNIKFIFCIVTLLATICSSQIGYAIQDATTTSRDIATGARNPSYRANNYDHQHITPVGVGASSQQVNSGEVAQKSIDPSARIGLYQALMEMESKPTENLQECAQWFEANANYEYLLNEAQARLRIRPKQVAKKQECDAMNASWQQTKSQVDKFKRLIDDPQATRDNPQSILTFFDEIDATVQQQTHLNEFSGYLHSASVQDKLRQLEESMNTPLVGATQNGVASITEKLDEVQELDQAIRLLIDSEETNSETDVNNLNEMADIMQDTLANGRIKLGSPRFKYLAATVDAAYEVVDLWHAKHHITTDTNQNLDEPLVRAVVPDLTASASNQAISKGVPAILSQFNEDNKQGARLTAEPTQTTTAARSSIPQPMWIPQPPMSPITPATSLLPTSHRRMKRSLEQEMEENQAAASQKKLEDQKEKKQVLVRRKRGTKTELASYMTEKLMEKLSGRGAPPMVQSRRPMMVQRGGHSYHRYYEEDDDDDEIQVYGKEKKKKEKKKKKVIIEKKPKKEKCEKKVSKHECKECGGHAKKSKYGGHGGHSVHGKGGHGKGCKKKK